MSLYLDPAAPPALLSEDAIALTPEQLDAQAYVAEQVLGLSGTSYFGEDADAAGRAVALQVNYQVALPAEVWAISSETRPSGASTTYRDVLPDAHPLALQIVGNLVAASEPDSGSVGGWAVWGPRR